MPINTGFAFEFQEPEQLPIIEISNVSVVGAGKSASGIWWVPVGQRWELVGDVSLPDGEFMIMIERVVDAVTSVGDDRLIASILDGRLSLPGRFDISGNYVLDMDRINRGLERTSAPFRLYFEKVEFDAYRLI